MLCYNACWFTTPERRAAPSLLAISKETPVALDKEDKTGIITDYQVHGTDTGSPDVQVALLTERINQLIEHRYYGLAPFKRKSLLAEILRMQKAFELFG